MQSEYFDDSKHEYVITSKDNSRNWNNYLGNLDYGMVINNNGIGYNYFSASEHSTDNLIENVITQKQLKIMFVKDTLTNKIWSTVSQDLVEPVNLFECRHGSGYTIIKSVCNETVSRTTYFVPIGEKFEIWHLKLSNTNIKKRSISLCTFFDYQNNFINVYSDDNSDSNLRTYKENTNYKGTSCLNFLSNNTLAHNTDFDIFFRDKLVNQKIDKKRKSIKSNVKCSMVQIDTELEPLETKDFIVFLGAVNTENEKNRIIERFGNLKAVETEFDKITNNKTCITNAIRIF